MRTMSTTVGNFSERTSEREVEPQSENRNLEHKLTPRSLLICVCVPDVQSILERLGSDRTLLKESVLIGCSEQNQARFCLDVGKNTLELKTL